MPVVHKIAIRNIKSINMLDYEVPEGASVIYVLGENEAGKSTVLDTFAYLLEGKKGIPDDVIHHGQERARAEMVLSDGTKVTRKITKNTTTVKVVLPDGKEPKGGPQGMLDSLHNGISLDPLKIKDLSDRELRELLVRISGKGEALADIDRRRVDAAEERTIVGRELKKLQGAAATAESIPADLPEEAPDVQMFRETYELALSEKQERDAVVAELARSEEQLKGLRLDLIDLQQKIESKEDLIRSHRDEVGKPLTRDVELVRAALTTAEEQVRAVHEAASTRQVLADLDSKEKEYEAIDTKVSDVDAERKALLSNLDIGVNGVVISEAGVTVDGILSCNLSTSQWLKFGCGLVMKEAPALRMVRIRNGNDLDHNSREYLEQLTKDNKFQAWVEYVRQDKETGLLLTETLEESHDRD